MFAPQLHVNHPKLRKLRHFQDKDVIFQKKKAPAGAEGPSSMLVFKKRRHFPETKKPAGAEGPSSMLVKKQITLKNV